MGVMMIASFVYSVVALQRAYAISALRSIVYSTVLFGTYTLVSWIAVIALMIAFHKEEMAQIFLN
jgi:O-antigen ligase